MRAAAREPRGRCSHQVGPIGAHPDGFSRARHSGCGTFGAATGARAKRALEGAG